MKPESEKRTAKTQYTQFTLNYPVKWVSQSHGCATEKGGVVVEVVAAGERPDRIRFPDLYRGSGCGLSRDHESYVVSVDVGKIIGSSVRHYWPRVSALVDA
jgi:hypothetical protein